MLAETTDVFFFSICSQNILLPSAYWHFAIVLLRTPTDSKNTFEVRLIIRIVLDVEEDYTTQLLSKRYVSIS